MRPVVASYREFAPSEVLRDYVRAFFSFIPGAERTHPQRRIICEVLFSQGDSFCPPMFADGNASMVFSLGMTCHADGVWQRDPAGWHGKVIGAVSGVNPAWLERPAMIGVYFHAAQLASFTSVPACELTDRDVDLADLWGKAVSDLSIRLAEMNEAGRIDALESVLLSRIGNRGSNSAVQMPRLAAWVVQQRGRVTVERLAVEAGVSRQHLSRLFRESIGISPKLYCRLARFQSGLVYAGCGKDVDWAQTALEMGYADQSHMIAEFREFSSLTPQMLAGERWFHPFIGRARRMYGIEPERRIQTKTNTRLTQTPALK